MTLYTFYNVSGKQNEKECLGKIRSSSKACKTYVMK